MSVNPQIKLNKVSKKFRLYSKNTDRVLEALMPHKRRRFTDFYAVRNLDLHIYKGETVGIVGRNGTGKSTLLKLIAGITLPTSGQLKVSGNVVPLLDMGGGFHPELSGYDNVYYYTTLLGYSKEETADIIQRVVDFAEVGDFINQPLKTYSTGMRSRLAFSVSININPEILLVDEVLAVGDESFKKKSKEKMQELFKSGNTILFVSHSPTDIKELCTKAVMLYNGEKMAEGNPDDVLKYYYQFYQNPDNLINKPPQVLL
ncbi:MAG: ABC transporter ATP-binding protein [Bacteroidales bacterium]|nr:ABC transporter ATP-binding protein [Bacteroidales bacterium]MCF6341198.1 ABC transporter ATP-binding protein [Bacteroidales bacterium]